MPFRLTKNIHRDVYDILSAEEKENQQNGRIVLIIGGGSGIGAVCYSLNNVMRGSRGPSKGYCRCIGSCASRRRHCYGRRAEKLEETAADLRKMSQGTKILTMNTDLTADAHSENGYKQIQKTFRRPAHVVLVSAGTANDLPNAGEHRFPQWRKVHAVRPPQCLCIAEVLAAGEREKRLCDKGVLHPISAEPQRARKDNHQR